MAYEDRNGLPHSYGNSVPQSSEDGLPHSDEGENVFSSSSNGGRGHHASSNLPTPPPVKLPKITLSPRSKT